MISDFEKLPLNLSVDGLSVNICLSTDKLSIDGCGLSIDEIGLSIDGLTSTNANFLC